MIRQAIERCTGAVSVWARPIIVLVAAGFMASLSAASVDMAVDALHSGFAPLAGLAAALATYTAIRAVQVLAFACWLGR